MNNTSLNDISQPFVIVTGNDDEREDVSELVLDYLKIRSGSYVSFDELKRIHRHEDIFDAFQERFPNWNSQRGLEMAFFEAFVAGFDAGNEYHPAVRGSIAEAIRNCRYHGRWNLIHAIKTYRQLTGVTLKEAKDVIERDFADLLAEHRKGL